MYFSIGNLFYYYLLNQNDRMVDYLIFDKKFRLKMSFILKVMSFLNYRDFSRIFKFLKNF